MRIPQNTSTIEGLVKELLFLYDAEAICEQIEEMYEGYISRDIIRPEGEQLFTYSIMKDLKSFITKAAELNKQKSETPTTPTTPPATPLKVVKLVGELVEERRAI